MSHLNYQKQCESQLETIKNMKVTRAAKIAMLESFSQILREKHESEKNKAKENLSTSFSENQSNFSTCER